MAITSVWNYLSASGKGKGLINFGNESEVWKMEDAT